MSSAPIWLSVGKHDTREKGMCLMETIAWFTNEPYTDTPNCVSHFLREFGLNLNDMLNDDERQLLVPTIEQLPGTANDGMDDLRAFMAADWLTRTCVPAWTENAGLANEAANLTALTPVTDPASLRHATTALTETATALDSLFLFLLDDAPEEPRLYARSAAADAAWATAWAPTRALADFAPNNVTWVASRRAAWEAVGSATKIIAVKATRNDTENTARATAGNALQPTTEQLQHSVIDLYTSMINPTEETTHEQQ